MHQLLGQLPHTIKRVQNPTIETHGVDPRWQSASRGCKRCFPMEAYLVPGWLPDEESARAPKYYKGGGISKLIISYIG